MKGVLMAQFSSSIHYQDLAENVHKLLKGSKQEGRIVTIAERQSNLIEITGDFETFDLTELEWWRAHLKFELRDIEPQDEEEREMRGQVAMYAPELAALMTGKTTVTVYKQDQDEWADITEEFMKRCQQHDLRWRKDA